MATSPWEGIWGFPLTPFGRRGIDLDALAAGTEHQIAGGVDVLCACGAIAQIAELRAGEHTASVGAVAQQGAGRAPVVATVLGGRGATALAGAAIEAGAAGIVLIPTDPRPAAAERGLRALAAAAPGVPIALYHRPPLRLEPAHLRRLAEIGELEWVKDGHRDPRLFRRLAAAAPRLRWISAWEDVALPFWALGCTTFAPASTAYAPEYSRAWRANLRDGDLAGARALLEAHAYPLIDLRLARPGIDIAVVKAAMDVTGVPAGGLRPPAKRLLPRERAEVERLVAAMRAALRRDAARRRRRAS